MMMKINDMNTDVNIKDCIFGYLYENNIERPICNTMSYIAHVAHVELVKEITDEIDKDILRNMKFMLTGNGNIDE